MTAVFIFLNSLLSVVMLVACVVFSVIAEALSAVAFVVKRTVIWIALAVAVLLVMQAACRLGIIGGGGAGGSADGSGLNGSVLLYVVAAAAVVIAGPVIRLLMTVPEFLAKNVLGAAAAASRRGCAGAISRIEKDLERE